MATRKKASIESEPTMDPEPEFRAEPAPARDKPVGKPIPERLRLKREIQAATLAGRKG